MSTFEKLEYLKELPFFHYLDNWSMRGKEWIYYFQEEKNETFVEGGIIMIPVDQINNIPIIFYQNKDKERFFEPEFFPKWFLSIATNAARQYETKTRLRKIYADKTE